MKSRIGTKTDRQRIGLLEVYNDLRVCDVRDGMDTALRHFSGTMDANHEDRIGARQTENTPVGCSGKRGGTTGGEKGELTIVIGDEKELLDEYRVLLATMGTNLYHVGPLGWAPAKGTVTFQQQPNM